MGNYIYIFLHIPKTGGTTFRKHLEKNFTREELLLIDYRKYRFVKGCNINNLVLDAIKKDLDNLSKSRKRKLKVIYGHEIPFGIHKYFEKECRYVTFFRNPESRVVSLYNFFLEQCIQEKPRRGKN